MLEKEKVKFLGSKVLEKTGYSVILDGKNHNRTVLTFKGPGNSIRESEIPRFKTKWSHLVLNLGISLSLILFPGPLKVRTVLL